MPVLPKDQVAAIIQDTLVEINRGLWHTNKNQGVDGATALPVELPDSVAFQITIVPTDGLNAIARVSTTSTPEVSSTDTTTTPTVITTDQQGQVIVNDNSTAIPAAVENITQRSGDDVRTEELNYEEVS